MLLNATVHVDGGAKEPCRSVRVGKLFYSVHYILSRLDRTAAAWLASSSLGEGTGWADDSCHMLTEPRLRRFQIYLRSIAQVTLCCAALASDPVVAVFSFPKNECAYIPMCNPMHVQNAPHWSLQRNSTLFVNFTSVCARWQKLYGERDFVLDEFAA